MPVISTFRNSLVAYANNPNEAAWCRDLVAMVLNSNGSLTNENYETLISEINNNIQAPSFVVAANSEIDVTPRLTLHKLKHTSGVRAVLSNQTITFCPDYFTYIHGLNGSGKSSYYAILRNLVSANKLPLLQNIYDNAPLAINVELTYAVNGVQQPPFIWNGVAATPMVLNYVRVFDKQIAQDLLRPVAVSKYEFHPFMLQLYGSISNAVIEIEQRIGHELGHEADNLKAIYGPAYIQALSDTLRSQFIQELKDLGLSDLVVDFEICNVFASPFIRLTLQHTHRLEEVLSEGELKAVSLALFIAECEVNPVKNPIIIDDPVNSLDSRIISYFIERISKLDNQVILFSHNMQMSQLFWENTLFKHYKSVTSPIPANAKKQAFSYTLVFEDRAHAGYVIEGNTANAKYFLDQADVELSAVPFLDNTKAVALLRKAVESTVDDSVFRGICPVKFRGRSNIMWDNLKQMLAFPSNEIDDLKDMYNRLSNGGEHIGYAGVAAPLDKATLQGFSSKLRMLMATYPIL